MSEVFGVDPELLGDPELEGATVDASEDGEQIFYVIKGSENKDTPYYDYMREAEMTPMTAEELEEYYNSDDNSLLRETFSSFDDYKNYMSEMTALYDEGEITKFWEIDQEESNVFVQDLYDRAASGDLSEEEFQAWLAIESGADPSGYFEYDRTGNMNEALRSEAVQELNEKYGIASSNDFGYGGEYTNSDGDRFAWNGSSWVQVYENETNWNSVLIQAAVGIALGAMTGAGISGALTTSAGTAGSVANSIAAATGIQASTIGAVGGGIASSAISQLALTGEVDPLKLLQAGLTAGIVDTASLLSNMDPALADSEYLGFIDDQVNALADALGTNYDTALDIVTGVATGVVNGGDLESIVSGVASTYGASQITDYIEDNIGLAIPNFFREGTTEINRDALENVTRTFLEDALAGDIDSGTLLDMGLGYVREDGSFAFLDPRLEGSVDLPFDFDFPGLDFEFTGGPNFDISIESADAQAEFEQDVYGDYVDSDEQDTNVVIQYDEDLLDFLSGFGSFAFNADGSLNLDGIDIPALCSSDPEKATLLGIECPEIPEIPDLPDIPELCANDPEQASLLGIECPDINIPDLCTDDPEQASLLGIECPDINVPDLCADDPEQASLLGIECPDINVPDLCADDPEQASLLGIECPDINIETSDVDIDTPDIDLDIPDLDLGGSSEGSLAQAPKGFYSGISYQIPTIQGLIQNPQTDYTASLNDLINRNSGMFA